MTLNKLLKAFHIPCEDARILQGISDDSREIEKDCLFVLRHGKNENSLIHMEEALRKGGVVLCDLDIKREHVYYCSCVEHLVQALLEFYYGDLCACFCVIGVTGTSGKTSVASLITQLLRIEGKRVMQIGTGFVKDEHHMKKTHNTTPGCFQLARLFSQATKENLSYIVMEVSSHAIDQNRICFLHFDMILYTNITQDHLDYHLTGTHYRYTKFKLRRYLKTQGTIIYNADMPYMQELVHLANYHCICFGTKQAHFPIAQIALSDHNVQFELQGYHYQAPLLGMMNVYNLCEALIVLRRLKVSYERLQEDTRKLTPIEGRMEILQMKNYSIWLDYAHTADALENLLLFANQVKRGRIITIIGCGGDRDRTKRPVMGCIASRYSDIAIFTSDNPRGESVYEILEDMKPQRYQNTEIFENRFFAIKHSVKIAQNSDIIIIAGKGNEDTITIQGEEYLFSDKACIRELFDKEVMEWN